MNFMSRNKLIKVSDPTGAGTTPVTSAFVDTAGYDGALFFTSFGTGAANNTMKAQQSTAANGSDAADLTGTALAPGASDEDQWLEIIFDGQQERYLGVIVTPATSSTIGDIWCILYGPRAMSVSNVTSGTITGEAHQGPEEGTA